MGWPHVGYEAAFLPGERITLTAYDAIEPGDPVDVYGHLICRRHVAGGRYLGVASTRGGPGDQVSITVGRVIHDGAAQGSIPAGTLLVTSGLAGYQVAAGTTAPVGVALTTAADGSSVRWAQL